MPRLLYSLMLYLGMPLVILRLLWRARKQPGYLKHVQERFGYYQNFPAGMPCIWVHAVSVGETRAAAPLIKSLRDRYPGHQVLLTHMTPTGRETGNALFGGQVVQAYLPYDFPGAVARFVKHFRPVAGVLMETEIWPNLVHECGEEAVPLYLVNARLSEYSHSGYRRAGRLISDALQGFAAIAAQTAADAVRLTELGAANVIVSGNLKFDQELPAVQLEQGRQWRASAAGRRVILAASTREGEEKLLLDALTPTGGGSVLWVIVPRHPQRFDEVAEMIEARGIQLQRRSKGMTFDSSVRVLLGDSMGEMAVYFGLSDIVLMGGSFMDFGSHNLIEPCAAGKPVIVGPSTYNFSEVADEAVSAGAALRSRDMNQAVELALQLADDETACQRMGEAGATFAAAHRGAIDRVLRLVKV